MNGAATPFVSVVLCTRNRADLLGQALASLVDQRLSATDYEILVVDNGSTDHTAAVAARYGEQAPVRYLMEPRLGLCTARNTGWQAAHGPIVAYFDDDALARPGWLRAIQETFSGHQAAGIGMAGGPVAPLWQAPRPSWLEDPIAASLTIIDWGESAKDITNADREWLVGANLAVPRLVLEEVGGFHPWLDRVGNNLLSSGDVFLQKQILRRGYRCRYVPGMAIGHLVPAARLRRGWFVRRYYWQGVSDAIMYVIERSPSLAERVSIAWARAGRLTTDRQRLRALLSSAPAPQTFTLKCFGLIDVGFVMGLLGAARR